MTVTMVLPSTFSPAAVMVLQPAITGIENAQGVFAEEFDHLKSSVAVSLAVLAM